MQNSRANYPEIIKLGELFEIEAGDIRVHTKLQDILEDQDFLVLQPTVKGVPLREQYDMPFRFSFYRPNGVYVFDAMMVSAFDKEGVRLCRFKRVSQIKRVQRRRFYRLPIVLDTFIEHAERISGVQEKIRGKTVNISENSVQISCFACLTEGESFFVTIRLSEKEKITMEGKVLKCISPLNKTGPFEVVLLYEDCHAEDRERLRRYIFRQQVLVSKRRSSKYT